MQIVLVDSRFRRFNGPKHIRVDGDILGKTKEPVKPWPTGHSHVLTVPFSESIERKYFGYDILEKDGSVSRRNLLFREVLDGEKDE